MGQVRRTKWEANVASGNATLKVGSGTYPLLTPPPLTAPRRLT